MNLLMGLCLNIFKTYEEAELACLNKLIQTVENGE